MKKLWLAIFDDLHEVTYISINPYENIESFKDHGRKNAVEGFEQHKPDESRTLFLGLLLLIWYVNALSLLLCYSWLSYICNFFHSLSYWKNNPIYILSCIVFVVVNLWMIELWQLPHSNQDTQVSIKSYHRALRHWFSLEAKGLKGCCVDWLV